MIDHEVGNVIECLRDHFTFKKNGDLITLNMGELLIITEVDYYQATAIRVDTSESVVIQLLEVPFNVFDGDRTTYRRIWP